MLTFLSLFRCGTSTVPRERHLEHTKSNEVKILSLAELHFLNENANKTEYAAWRSTAFNLDESSGWFEWMVELLNDSNAATVWNSLKIPIQRGVPDALRKIVWLKANDADNFTAQHPTFYNAIMRDTFGTKVPDNSSGRCPTFSGGILGLQEDVEGTEIDMDEWEVDFDLLATPRLNYSSRLLNISESAEDLLKTWFSGTPASSPSLTPTEYSPDSSVAAMSRKIPPEHNFWLPPAIIEPVSNANRVEQANIFGDTAKCNVSSLVPMDTHEWHDFRTYMKSTHKHRMRQSQRMTYSRHLLREKLRDESFISSEDDYNIPKYASDLYPSVMGSGQLLIRTPSASVGSLEEAYQNSSNSTPTPRNDPLLQNISYDTSSNQETLINSLKPVQVSKNKHIDKQNLLFISPHSQSTKNKPASFTISFTDWKAAKEPIAIAQTVGHHCTKTANFLRRLKSSFQFGKKPLFTIPTKESLKGDITNDILLYGKEGIVSTPSSMENFSIGDGNISVSPLENILLASANKDAISDEMIEEVVHTENPLKMLTREEKEINLETQDNFSPSEANADLSNSRYLPSAKMTFCKTERNKTKECSSSTYTSPVVATNKADIQLLENVTEFSSLLTENGCRVVRSVLWCLNSLHASNFEFCPIIPHLACLLALTMDAQEIFCVLHNVVKRAVCASTSGEKDHKRPYLTYTRSDFVRFVKLITGGIRRHQPQVFHHLRSLNVDLAAWVARAVQDGFAKMLPFDYVLRIYGAFLYAIFKFLKKELLRSTTLDEIEDLLYHIPANATLREVDLTKLAYRIRLRSRAGALAALSHESPSPYLLTVQMKHLYRPRLHEVSDVVNDAQWEIVWTWLSDIARILDPMLIYQSLHDGMSILALIKKLENRSNIPMFFFIKTDQVSEIFGGFFPFSFSLLKQAKEEERYSESFLFQLSPEEKLYCWTGKNQMCLKCTTEYIAVGGLDVAIYIDSYIHHGRTRPCSSYDSPQFVTTPLGDFVIKVMEIWQLL